MSKKDKLIDELEKLNNKVEVIQEQNKLYKCRCMICGNVGCNVLSLKHKGPVHSACITKETL